MNRLIRLACSAAALCWLAACGGGGGGGDGGSASGTVSGGVVKGPVRGATVCAYAISGGAKGAQIPMSSAGGAGTVSGGCYVTAADGRYSFTLPSTGDVLLEATGGDFCTSEAVVGAGGSCATGALVSLGGATMTAVVTVPAAGSTATAYITPLTTAAAIAAGSGLSASTFDNQFTTLAGQALGPNSGVTPSSQPTTATQPYLALVSDYLSRGGTMTAVVSGLQQGTTTFARLKSLVLYDAPAGTDMEKFGLSYAIMLRNLLSHFDVDGELVPVHEYTAGRIGGYASVFYLGSYFDNAAPPALLADIAATNKTVVWFKYNLWRFSSDAQYGFAQRFGFEFSGLRGLNADPSPGNPAPGFFDTITYKAKPFVKHYSYDSGTDTVAADPDIGVVRVTDPAKASTLLTVANPQTGETAPYVVRSGRFWYFADIPLTFIGPRDRYLVFADLLHDILNVAPRHGPRAMVRLEDVSAITSVSAMQSITDYLYGRQIPFSIAMIPKYVDAYGIYNGGVPQTIELANATNLKTAVNYAVARGAEVLMHGYTHQYENLRNPDGVSGVDYEFWNIVANQPVSADSEAWARSRIQAGLADFAANGFAPVAWETPHYHASAAVSRVVAQLFATTYQRVTYYTADRPNFNAPVARDFASGQFFPYVIPRDYYGQRVLPENLGNIQYTALAGNDYTWRDICTNAEYALTVRGGFASFFFHPFLAAPGSGVNGLADFKSAIECISGLGYTWVSPTRVRE